jgi:GDP-L-fucose synthase
MGFFKNSKVLVTGGSGMIGRYLVDLLIKEGARVCIASLDDKSRAHPQAEFAHVNLMKFENCLEVCKNMDFVFHVAGIKGSPAMATHKPASFFVPLITFNTNMMEAARQSGVKSYLFTSSVGVYSPAEIFHEDSVWKTFPSNNDRFAGWAKRMGELQAQAYDIEFGWKNISIVRPANVYGRHDNFDPKNAMVIPSLIRRAVDGENPLVVWGDGSPVRDFIHALDVARGMLFVMEREIFEPLNLGCGDGVNIKDLVEIIAAQLPKKPEIIWDTSKPAGDQKRILDMSKARSYGFKSSVSLEEGIKDTIQWYVDEKASPKERFNVFTEGISYL